MLSVETGERVDAQLAEAAIDAVLHDGKQADLDALSKVQTTLSEALERSERLLEEEFLNETSSFEAENLNRVTQAKQLVNARADRKLGQLRTILAQLSSLRDERQRRVIPLTEARIRQAEQERETQLARIDRQGRAEASFRPVVGGLIIVTA
jgi:hypothetical protein